MYVLVFDSKAKKDISEHKRSGTAGVCRKIETILEELIDHPRTGTGKPEMLKGNLSGYCVETY
ncbi:hypothetical protein FACS18942_02600 [Planctomycetales bacterium]|nr:hypothetical protein FACS18942_02600 [Planctomycetales bacterium]GHT36311.1 hypothetical protein FACS189427_07670 [Planctomycetales bacterium]